jgi:Fur family peroxide stress response transcriptional regulator
MRPVDKKHRDEHFTEQLTTRGFRSTPQREHVYAVLIRKPDHPTAEEVFIRAKRELPEISMATVYNCLDALVKCGMVRQVTLDRGATRFCPNMREHGHFYCDTCEQVTDLELSQLPGIRLPAGFTAVRYDVAIHGQCRTCRTAKVGGSAKSGNLQAR